MKYFERIGDPAIYGKNDGKKQLPYSRMALGSRGSKI